MSYASVLWCLPIVDQEYQLDVVFFKIFHQHAKRPLRDELMLGEHVGTHTGLAPEQPTATAVDILSNS